MCRTSTYECVATSTETSASVSTAFHGPMMRREGSTLVSPEPIPIRSRAAPSERVSDRLRVTSAIDARRSERQPTTSGREGEPIATFEWQAHPAAEVTKCEGLLTSAMLPVAPSSPPDLALEPELRAGAPPATRAVHEPSARPKVTVTAVPSRYSGYSVVLDGVDDSIVLGSATVLIAAKDAWTNEAWVRHEAFAGP
jgi:hypothetical protein